MQEDTGIFQYDSGKTICGLAGNGKTFFHEYLIIKPILIKLVSLKKY
jgi:hypothetical protein